MRQAAVSAVAFAVAAMIVIGGYFVAQQGASQTSPTVTTTVASQSSQTTGTVSSQSSQTTTILTSSGSATGISNSSDGLQLQLQLVFSQGSASGGAVVSMVVDERNTLSTANNVSESSAWAVSGLAVAPCPNESDVPFGVALYQGYYTATNVTLGHPLEIFPVVACPMYIRLVTGYLFQPSSDYAQVLPGTGNATQMLSKVNVTGTYSGSPATNNSPTPLAPGTYTAVAGDEWGALVVQQFIVSSDGTATLVG